MLDLYCEFRNATNGRELPAGRGLLGALVYHGLDSIAADEKQDLRELAMRGGLYTERERESLLDYCLSDVNALAKLLPKMLPGSVNPRRRCR